MQREMFKAVTSAKVLVVGDIILDQYIYGETRRISPEAPVPVVKVNSTEERPGGAANVAVNVSALDVGVTLLGITGHDEASSRLQNLLQERNVDCRFIKQTDVPTIAKLRILSQHQQLLRLDYEESGKHQDDAQLLNSYREAIKHANIVVLSDYAKGSLGCVTDLIELANREKIPVLVDPKSSDFSIYRNATLITPNLKEFQAVVGEVTTTDEIVEKGSELCRQINLSALLVTRGEKGMTLIRANESPVHLKAQTHEVYDVTGAGDTVIATLAAALASNYDLEQATSFSNIAAGMVVEKLGAATVTTAELNSQQQVIPGSEQAVLNEASAKQVIDEARRKGEQIVMTNGCFDILHAGHVTYLEKARSLGDRLVIAVNSDDSVKQLKGPDRPVNALASRMKILAALSCVDIVVSFEEDTPERLIQQFSPDILVKGGDYTEDQIAGAEHVKKTGGDVVILPFEQGHSTSLIVEKIKKQQEVQE